MAGRGSLHARLGAALVASLLACLAIGGLGAGSAQAAGSAMVSGFDTNTLARNDDGSSASITLPFSIDFFGHTYSSLYVNNNGNLTFNSPLSSYTPTGLSTYGSPIIAPFWADVDTVPGGNVVTYGTGTVDGHQAFGVNWPGVDCYATTAGGLNYFQVLLIDRSDIAPGDFDIEFNYNQIQWDSGQASSGNSVCQNGTSAQVGYTNGSTNALELNGSGVDGAFLDGGPDALISGSQNSTTPGRYIFPIRAGGGGGSIGGQVTHSGTPVAGALVSACSTGGTVQCFLGNTDDNGHYLILGVPPATGSLAPQSGYEVTVSPPAGSDLNSQTQPQAPNAPLSVTTGATTAQDFVLTGPTPPPNHTVVQGNGTQVVGGAQIPVVYWQATSPISTEACDGGSVSIKITAENTQTGLPQTVGPFNLTQTGFDSTTGLGIFTGEIPALYPLHGSGAVEIDVSCGGVAQTPVTFSIYIDPSGTVVDQANNPIAGATVTLLSSDSLGGSFTALPDGSAIMSPGNRNNPDSTGAAGQFGWDTLPGFYEVRATAPGCNTVTTPAFQVPPAQTGLQIQLTCIRDNDLALVNVPADITTAATGPSGTSVAYAAPSASDESGDSPTATVNCDHSSGSTFAVGSTKVTCTATSADDANSPVTQSFYVTVTDSDLALHNAPANITTDATSPSGAVVNYTAPTATDEGGQTPSVICDHPSGSTFAIGDTRVTCSASASDGDDAISQVSSSFTVHVKSAAEQLADLDSAVGGVGPGKSLDNKVTSVQAYFAAGDTADACGTLAAFIHEVSAQSGKHIPAATARAFLADAQRIGAVIGCSTQVLRAGDRGRSKANHRHRGSAPRPSRRR